MPDSSRDHRPATAARDRFAPHPALRTLWALGGGPLAFVRADEQLAERLAGMVRDDVPTIVEEDGRALGALTANVDLANVARSNDAAGVPEAPARSHHEPNDTSSAHNFTDPSPLSRILTKLREQSQSSPSSVPSAPSAPLRVIPLLHSPPAPRPQHVRAPTPEPAPSKTTKTEKPSTRWPSVPPVTIGPKPPNQPPAAAGQPPRRDSKPETSVLAAAMAPLSPIVQSLLDTHASDSPHKRSTDAITNVGARLLHVAEQVERKVAVARANTASKRIGPNRARRGNISDATTIEDGRRTESPAPQLAAASAPRTAAEPSAAASSASRSTAAFTQAAEPTELRGFRGLAMRAIAQDTPVGERAPMLQPLHHTRQGWADVDAPDAWSLDAAARLEGLDLDEVAS